MGRLSLVCFLTATLTLPPIDLSPRVIFMGDDLRIVCAVPKRADNRELAMGITGFTESDHQLDGVDAPVVFQLIAHHVPCHVGPAFCVTIRTNGRETHTRELVIAGCAEPEP
jgi:hypothetical protein